MNNRKKIVALVISLTLFFWGVAIPANAQWSIGNYENYGLPKGTISGIVGSVFFWLSGLFTFFGLIGFTVAGIMYLVSAGSDDMISKAKKYMMYSIVGVIVGLMGFVILQAATTLLGGTSSYF